MYIPESGSEGTGSGFEGAGSGFEGAASDFEGAGSGFGCGPGIYIHTYIN